MNWFIKLIVPKEYEYFNYVEDPDWYEAEFPYHKYRLCKNTGKFQKLESHCLGLNPPEYHTSWATLTIKPRFVIRGGTLFVKE